MKTIKIFLITLFLVGTTYAQVTMSVSVSDGVESTVLSFGIHPSATDGIDAALGEAELPPAPPGFYARFVGGSLGQGSATDLRYGTLDGAFSHSYTVNFKNDQGPSITFSWTSADGVTGTVKDLLGGIVINETLEGGGSVTIDNPAAISSLVITANYNYVAGPNNLASSETTPGQVDLTWQDNSSVETGFIIERKENSGGSYSQIATPSANSTSYSDNTVAANTLYYYRIKSVANGAQSDYSNETSITTQGPPFIAAPTGLSSTAPVIGKVVLSWTDNADNEDNFKIERKTGSNSYIVIQTLAANTTSFEDLSVAQGVTYHYRVLATNAVTTSAYSNETNITTLFEPISDPTNLIETANVPGNVSISWNDNSTNETGFKVERKISGGSFIIIAYLGANSTNYTDYSIDDNTTYDYRVVAYNSNTSSNYTNIISILTKTSPISAPSNLTASFIDVGVVQLNWSDNANNENSYLIQRKSNINNTYSTINTIAANSTSYIDSTVVELTTYTYRVLALNSNSQSNYSNTASFTTGNYTTINSPESLSGSSVVGKINLIWLDKSDNEQGFSIERRKGNTGDFTLVANVAKNNTSYADVDISEGTSYQYRIKAFNTFANSNYSNVISITSKIFSLPAPTDLTASAHFGEYITLTWIDNSDNESGFCVERKIEGENIYNFKINLDSNVVEFVDSEIVENTNYIYRVCSFRENYTSGHSNEVKINSMLKITPPTIDLPDVININNETEYQIYVWGYVNDTYTPDALLEYNITGAENKLIWNLDQTTGNLTVKSDNNYYGTVELIITVKNQNNLSSSDTMLVIIEDITSIDFPISEIPDKYVLYQNYPNPFNPTTNIKYYLVEEAMVELCIYNLLGEKINVMQSGIQENGFYTVRINALDWPGGIYFSAIKIYSTQSDKKYESVKKMVLIK